MGQALSNFATSRCGDTGQDEFQGSTWPLDAHIFSQRPGQQLIPTPLSWSRGSDSFNHPVTNYVANRIVWNPPLGSDPDGNSTSWTREVNQLGLDHLATRDESDSVRQLAQNPALSWSRGSDSFTALSWSSEESEVLKEVRERDEEERDEERETFPIPNPIPEIRQIPLSSYHGSDLFADLVTNSVPIPPPGSDPVRHLTSPSSESDSVSQLHRDPVFSSPKWLEEFLGDSSITDTIEESEVLKEVRERDEERETFPIPIPIPELLQIPLNSSHGSDLIDDLVTHSIPIPPPGSDPVRDSTSPSSESDSVSLLRRDPAISLPKGLDVSLRDSSITVLEEKKEVVREVLREERERDEERGGGAKVERVERWMKHYSSFHKILLVGEGDFSFSACLAVTFGCAHNIIATSLDSRGFLSNNYRNAMSNIESLTSRGAKVIHGVDATQMAKHFTIDRMTFDRIVFNFPHDGCFRNEFSRETQLWRQRKLVRLFMKNAKKMVNKMGEIHISHKSNSFFREWNLEQLATNEGLRVIESLHFRLTDYPGYHTKYGFRGDKNFDCNPSKTYKFGLKN